MSVRRITSEPIHRFYLAIEVLRSTGQREFPLQLASTFLWIAAHDGCTQDELVEATSMSPSAVSRNVTWLGPKHRSGKEGLRFVRRERDPRSHRSWRLYLTKEGEQFVHLIEQTLKS